MGNICNWGEGRNGDEYEQMSVCDANASKTYALLSLFYVQLLQYLHQLHVFDLI